MLNIEKITNNIKISRVKESETKSRFILEPLYRGYGHTVGNSLRRVMLSSIPGAAIKGVRIEGVLNEYSTIKGVKEAVTDIVLNVKEVVIKTDTHGERKMTLSVQGPAVITAADIVPELGVEIVNPEQVIMEVTEDITIDMEFLVDTGEGFVVGEEINRDNWAVDYIAVDAIYTPIRKVSYFVEDTMVGRITNYDKLTLELESDGSVELEDVLSYAVELLQRHLAPFADIGNQMEHLRGTDEEELIEEEEAENSEKEKRDVRIEDLDLSVRSNNGLKKAGIETLGQLGVKSITEISKIKNLGRKSIQEILVKLEEYGYEIKNDQDI